MTQLRFFITVWHPMARAASSMTPQLPLGDKTPGNLKTSRQPAPKQKKTPNLQGCGRNKYNAQPSRVRSKIQQHQQQSTTPTTKTTKTRIMDTSRTKKTPNLQGWGEWSRLLLQDLFLCFHQKRNQPPLTSCEIKRARARSNRVRRESVTVRNG